MTTPLFMYRCLQIGLSIKDCDDVTIGLVNDMYAEKMNDEYDWPVEAQQDDFDRLATSLNISGMIFKNENSAQGNSSNTQINFNGNYNFKDKTDVDYFMNQAALKLVTER